LPYAMCKVRFGFPESFGVRDWRIDRPFQADSLVR
jgi:hypothetical protein